MNQYRLIGDGFKQGFSLLFPDGRIRLFGACTYHDDDSSEVVAMEDGTFNLIHYGSSDEGFPEKGREVLVGEVNASYGYHEDERGRPWRSLNDMRSALIESGTLPRP